MNTGESPPAPLLAGGPFLGALPCAGEDGRPAARGVLFGAPLDVTGSFRPGTRFAPARIREASQVLEEYSLDLGEELARHPFCDLGDLDLAPGNLETSLARIEALAAWLQQRGKLPVVLGGEHLVSLPLIRAAAAAHPDLQVLQFDAHADLREEYLGERLSHATVMRHVVAELGPGRLCPLGVRSATAEEARFAAAALGDAWTLARRHPGRVCEPLRELLPRLAGRPVYVTLDLDVVDPAAAPGVGTPEPGGASSRELLQALALLRGLHVVGCDVVELSPPHDPAGSSAVLAAKLVREMLLLFA